MNSTTHTSERQGLIEMTLAMLISGTIGITVLLSGQALSDLIFFRCLFGALILGGLCWWRGIFRETTFSRRFWLASTVGGLALLINWYCLFSAYQKTSVGIATTVYNTQPFIFVLLSAIFFKEPLTRRILGWLAVSFVGLCLVASTKIGAVESYHDYLVGVLQALAAATLYAVASMAAKALAVYSPILIAFFQLLLGIILFLPMTNFTQLASGVDTNGVIAIVALGVVHTGVMYILLYGAIQKLAAYQVASLSFLYPAVALMIDFLFLDIRLPMIQLLGILLILAGAAGNNLQSVIARRLAR